MVKEIKMLAQLVFLVGCIFMGHPLYAINYQAKSSNSKIFIKSEKEKRGPRGHHGKKGYRGDHGKRGPTGISEFPSATPAAMFVKLSDFDTAGTSGTFRIFVYAPDGTRYTDGIIYDVSTLPSSVTITISPKLFPGIYILNYQPVTPCSGVLGLTLNVQNTANSNQSQIESAFLFDSSIVGDISIGDFFTFP